MITDEDIAANLVEVRARITRACVAVGRDVTSVRLVAVTKTHSPEVVRAAWRCGLRDFGENYAQELTDKAATLADLADVRWHFIGHLQRNKARAVVPVLHTVHSVDSVRLAVALGQHAEAVGRTIDVFVQVNIAGEASKSGCEPSEAEAVCAAIEGARGVRLRGLMTVPPATEDAREATPMFEALRSLRDVLGGPTRLAELSMGMTHDLEVAIACGATVVRVGSALFGARHRATSRQ